MRFVRLVCSTLLYVALFLPYAARAQTCVGDCSNDQSVTVDEVLTLVNWGGPHSPTVFGLG